MILLRGPAGVLTAEYRLVVLRQAPEMQARRASIEGFRAGELDAAIIEVFDFDALLEAVAREANAQRVPEIRRPGESSCFCSAGEEAMRERGALDVWITRSDPRGGLAVAGRCSACGLGWILRPHGAARTFTPDVGYDASEVDRIVAGIRGGLQAMSGGSRCHTTYRGVGGELFAEDFDEGHTDERRCDERTLRYVIESEPEIFVEVLREPLRARLREALYALDMPLARARLAELHAFGDCLHHAELLEAVLAWPDAKPDDAAVARMTHDVSGLDVLHAIRSVTRYGDESPELGRFALHCFAVLSEMLGARELPLFRRYRAGFRLAIGDVAGALEDLEWERARAAPDAPDASLQREIDSVRSRLER